MTPLTLNKEQKNHLSEKLKDYLLDELNVEIGEFDADFLLDFIGENVGVYYYNKGLQDAQTVLMRQFDQLTDAIAEIEQVTELNR